MLIGISGKISSGKDTVGKIIQYLVWKSRVERGELPLSVYSFSDFARETSFGKNQSGFEIKKFADKLKDFVCMLIGCTREQLEDQEFKNTQLGDEWIRYYCKEEGFLTYCIDDYRVDNPIPRNMEIPLLSKEEYESKVLWLKEIDRQSDLRWKESKGDIAYIQHNIVYNLIEKKLTPRLLLQIIGTDCIRDKVHPNAWVNALFADYKYEIHRSEVPTRAAGFIDQHVYPNWIITDMRFPNELEAVKSRGGITIRVNRPYTTVVGGNGIPATFNQNQFHPSETALDNAEFDYTIENNSSIEDLIHTVSLILKKEKVI